MSDGERMNVEESHKLLLGEITALEERINDLEAENERLRERIADIDDRTDLLRLVQDQEKQDNEQRQIALLQYLRRKADRNESGDRAVMDKDEAEVALHRPDIDRTLYYKDMKDAADRVGDDDVCWYSKKGERPQPDTSVLVLSLEDGELPAALQRRREQ